MLYGKVTGRFLAPDGSPLSGSVRFVPDTTAVLVSGVDPVTVLPAYVDVALDAQGYIADGATRGVNLVIPEDTVTNPPSWTYRVYPGFRHNGQGVHYASWSVEVTTTGADLTTAAKVPSVTAPGVVRGKSAYEVWLDQGNTGTEQDFIKDIARLVSVNAVDAVVEAQNASINYSNLEPTATTYTTGDGAVYDVVWLPDGTVVTATAPTFDDITDTYTIPATTGVEYLVGGLVVAAGTYGVTPPSTVTVDARPLDGYALKGTRQWSGSFTVDTTAPTPGTLGVTTTDTTADLTVSGASDNERLHATPYSYSRDAGATWTAWQAGATYKYTGLTASTSYTFQHRVRDATGNISVGTAVTKSTAATPTATVDVTEDFNVAAGTSYAGKTTTTGALAWVDAQGGNIFLSSAAVAVDGTRATGGGARLDPTVASASVAIDFVVDPTKPAERVGLWMLGPAATGTPSVFVQVRGSSNGTGCTVHAFDGAAAEIGMKALTVSTGRVAILNSGTQLTVTVDGTQVLGPFATPATTKKSVGFGLMHDAAAVTTPARADNFAVDYA